MRLLLASLAATLVGVAQANPYYDPAKPHHTPTGFRSVHAGEVSKPFTDLVRWRWEAWREGMPPPTRDATPAMLPRLRPLLANSQAMRRAGPTSARALPSATWIGHASVLVQCGGLNVLTDPIFSERASPVAFLGPRRAQPPGIALADLPPIDVVVISHNHYDHLDRTSVVLLNERNGGRTLFLVPLGVKPFLQHQGIANVVELDWWDTYRHHGVDFQLVPVQHWSARGVADRNESLWGGWAVFADDFRWYYSGDAGYSADFADTREKLASRVRGGVLFDLALLAIGAYEPRWFMAPQHMNPDEAVRAHRDLGARRSIGVHWGTFQLTDEPLDQPPKDLAVARQAHDVPAQDFFVIKVGETFWPAGEPPTTTALQ